MASLTSGATGIEAVPRGGPQPRRVLVEVGRDLPAPGQVGGGAVRVGHLGPRRDQEHQRRAAEREGGDAEFVHPGVGRGQLAGRGVAHGLQQDTALVSPGSASQLAQRAMMSVSRPRHARWYSGDRSGTASSYPLIAMNDAREWVTAEQYLRELAGQRSDGCPRGHGALPLHCGRWYAYSGTRAGRPSGRPARPRTRRTARSLARSSGTAVPRR